MLRGNAFRLSDRDVVRVVSGEPQQLRLFLWLLRISHSFGARWSANADIAMPPNLIVSTPEYRARADRLASQVHVAIILVPNLLCCPLFERTYNACGTSSSYIL